jgi:hypothetical protein
VIKDSVTKKLKPTQPGKQVNQDSKNHGPNTSLIQGFLNLQKALNKH